MACRSSQISLLAVRACLGTGAGFSKKERSQISPPLGVVDAGDGTTAAGVTGVTGAKGDRTARGEPKLVPDSEEDEIPKCNGELVRGWVEREASLLGSVLLRWSPLIGGEGLPGKPGDFAVTDLDGWRVADGCELPEKLRPSASNDAGWEGWVMVGDCGLPPSKSSALASKVSGCDCGRGDGDDKKNVLEGWSAFASNDSGRDDGGAGGDGMLEGWRAFASNDSGRAGSGTLGDSMKSPQSSSTISATAGANGLGGDCSGSVVTTDSFLGLSSAAISKGVKDCVAAVPLSLCSANDR